MAVRRRKKTARRAQVPAIDWQPWAPRQEQMPACCALADGKLLIQGGPSGEIFGGWRGRIAPLRKGARYRITVHVATSGISNLRHQTWVQTRAGNPTFRYLADVHPLPDGRCRYEMIITSEATEAYLDVLLVRCPGGRMVVEDVEIEPLGRRPRRVVRVCAVHHYLAYHPGRTSLENCREFAADIDEAVGRSAGRLDLVVLPEACSYVGIDGPHWRGGVQPDGPEVAEISAAAKRNGVWVAAGLFLYDGPAVYNCSVLFNRSGEIVGVHRKVQLPNQEWSDGLKPGDKLETFVTDFGRIGILICHETTYPEPARALFLEGAELIVVHIWGGREVCLRSRAVENGVWVITSGYDYPTQVIDPRGEVVSQAHPPRGQRQFVYASIDLNDPPSQPWYGDMRDLQFKERRDDLYCNLFGQRLWALPRWE